MSRSHVNCCLAAVCLVAVPGMMNAAVAENRKDHPNVLFFAVDDLNDWLGCLGGHPQVKTPNFDRLASRGVLFTEAHCAAPACAPSRTAVFSGMRPRTTLAYSNADNVSKLLEGHVTLPQYLSARGYHTMGGGKLLHGGKKASVDQFDECGPVIVKYSPFTDKQIDATRGVPGPWPMDRGANRPKVVLPLSGMPNDRKPGTLDSFDWGPVDADDEEMSDCTLADWAVQRLGSDYDRPFFLGVGFFRVHQPLFAPRKYFDAYPPKTVILPEVLATDLDDLSKIGRDFAIMAVTSGLHSSVVAQGQWEEAVSSYLACISFVDAMLGKVLDALDQSPHADNTMIVLWSDHGWHLGEKEHWGKWTCWTRSTRVPLMIVPPPSDPPGRFQPGRTCNRPVSLLDLYPTILELCGLEQKDGLQGRSLVPLLADPAREWDHAVVTTVGRANDSVQDARWRYIRYFDGTEELYDHHADPHEWHNLAADPEYVRVKEKLARHLPDDPHVAHFVRFGDWKAVIPANGAPPLLFTGLQDGNNLASNHPDVMATILDYVNTNNVTAKRLVISSPLE